MLKKTSNLSVYRTFANQQKVLVGHLVQGDYGVGFAYDPNYLTNYPNLSPFKLENTSLLQSAPKLPHRGLHGVFADSLPDGWGHLLQDRFFASKQINVADIGVLDRLAFVGDTGIGGLSYEPTFDEDLAYPDLNLYELGKEAQAIYDGQTDVVLAQLVKAGSSGGARPKAQIYTPYDNYSECRTTPTTQDIGWIVKFTSDNLPLGHFEGICEAIYLMMAQQAGIFPVKHHLFCVKERHWLGVQRFDLVGCYQNGFGRLHTHSVCGLLDADFRVPSLDYETLIRCTNILCKNTTHSQLVFLRMIFNLFAINQDDHSKNFAFLQDDEGGWSPAPAYDLTFNPLHHGEHTTAFMGYGKNPPKKAIQHLANLAGFDRWQTAKHAIEQVVQAISDFDTLAKQSPLDTDISRHIANQLNEVYKTNKHLLQP